MTLKRSKSRRRERLELESKILRWLEQILNRPPTSLGDRLDIALQSGVILCDLMKVCAPNAIRKVFRNAKPGTFQAHDNIAQFIKATRKVLGMDESFTFGSDYISDDDSFKQDIKMRFVDSCLLTFACRAHILRNLPLPDGIVGLEDEVRRVRGDEVEEEDDLSIKKSTIVRLQNTTKTSTFCPYTTMTRSFTQTLSSVESSKDNDDDEFICVDVVLFDGASDVVYVLLNIITHEREFQSFIPQEKSLENLEHRYCKSTTTAEELREMIRNQLFVRNIDSYELFSDETGEMFEIPPKTMMKHLFRDDGAISPIVHLRPLSDKMIKIGVDSDNDERRVEILVHVKDTMRDLRRAINASVPYVECDEPYVFLFELYESV